MHDMVGFRSQKYINNPKIREVKRGWHGQGRMGKRGGAVLGCDLAANVSGLSPPPS